MGPGPPVVAQGTTKISAAYSMCAIMSGACRGQNLWWGGVMWRPSRRAHAWPHPAHHLRPLRRGGGGQGAPVLSWRPGLIALTPAGVVQASSLRGPPPPVCAAPPPSLCPVPWAVECAPAQGGGDARRAPGRSTAVPPVPPQRMWRTVCVCVSRKPKGVAVGGAAPGLRPWHSVVAVRKALPLHLVRGRPPVCRRGVSPAGELGPFLEVTFPTP